MRISYGLDWLSGTSTVDATGGEWYTAYCEYRDRNAPLFEQPFRLQGGYIGLQTESLAWAYSNHLKSYFFKGSGGKATDYACEHIHKAGRITRIDLRVDVELAEVDIEVASRAYDANAHRGKPRYNLIKSGDLSGQTLYVGSKASDMFGRLYDKGAERGNAPGCFWRYEIVIRKPHAQGLYDEVRASGKLIPNLVHTWFLSRNVEPIFPFGSTAIVSRADKVETTPEQKLAWLRKSVAPTIAKLIDAGFAQETFEALGISQPRFDK